MQVARGHLSASFPAGSPAQAPMCPPPPPSLMASSSAYSQSFPEPNGYQQQPSQGPLIYTAVYSNVVVYEMEVHGINVMRRRSDSWLNATQILKVAGVEKGKRTKVLEKEILIGQHEKVQGGYGKYQGTWVSYTRGREFCRQYGVEDVLRPLLDYDIGADGAPGQGLETPTKEQAMAASRKLAYTQAMDSRAAGQNVGGTFFSNISTTATSALHAINRVARMQSPGARPGSAHRRPAARPQALPGSQGSFRQGSQHSLHSLVSERSFGANGASDPAYRTYLGDGDAADVHEPPRKRIRASQDESFSQRIGIDVPMCEGSPTEPAESFYQGVPNVATPDGDVKTALVPLPMPTDKRTEEHQALLTGLFADPERTDFSDHGAILHLSGADLDTPIDNNANTALHWAATLARVSLMRVLVSRGANMFRGNASGQTPLMSAVTVNNSLDHSCFPEMLDILAPLIEVRDSQGRTILHHIAVTCGIKGRSASSKYYLEALLEYLVRSTPASSQVACDVNGNKSITLRWFMQEMVNARDHWGNTALNLAARVGSRNIISQLMEVQADPSIANNKGTRPMHFGVGADSGADLSTAVAADSPSKAKAPLSKWEELSKELQPLFGSFVQSSVVQFTQEARLKHDKIDLINEKITQVSALQKTELAQLEALRARKQLRNDRAKRIFNLQQWIDTQRRTLATMDRPILQEPKKAIGAADLEGAGIMVRPDDFPDEARQWAISAGVPLASHGAHYAHTALPPELAALSKQLKPQLDRLPSTAVLRQRVQAYTPHNAALTQHSRSLKQQDGELEAKYRKVVSLCTHVDEDQVDEVLNNLTRALESDTSDAVEGGRVKDFLRKLENVEPMGRG